MLTSPPAATQPHRFRCGAFTLVELLVVMGVIAILIGVTAPIMTSIKNAGDVNKAVYDIAGIFEQSRAYAMANNTYVYVGVEESDISQATGSAAKPGVGRVNLAVVATRDGTQGFSSGALKNWGAAYPSLIANLITVGKPMEFDNLHLPDLGTPPPAGKMARPPLVSDNSGASYSLGSAQCVSATPFDYPIGSPLGAGQFSFTKVIQFDPQGVARIQSASNPSAITPYMEIGLQQTHGGSAPVLAASPTSGNIAAIQIDGMTGTSRIYRP